MKKLMPVLSLFMVLLIASTAFAGKRSYSLGGTNVSWATQLGATPTTSSYTPGVTPSDIKLGPSGSVYATGAIAYGSFNGTLSGESDVTWQSTGPKGICFGSANSGLQVMTTRLH